MTAHLTNRSKAAAVLMTAAAVAWAGVAVNTAEAGPETTLLAYASADDPPPAGMADILKALQGMQTGTAGNAPTDAPAGGNATDMDKIMKALTNAGSGKPPPSKGAPPAPFKPVGPATSAALIPAIEGLMVVAARREDYGDFEWFTSIRSVGGNVITYHYMQTDPALESDAADQRKPVPSNADPAAKTIQCDVVVDVADLAKARSVRNWICKDALEHYPGITFLRMSTEVLAQLRSGQAVDFHFPGPVEAKQLEAIRRSRLGASWKPIFTDYAGLLQYTCKLTRAGTGDVAIPVIVNDEPVELPALRAQSVCGGPNGNDGYNYNFYILDQPSNPMILVQEWPDLSSRGVQVIKISFPEAKRSGASNMEKALADNQPVQIYDIYFDFNRSVIKPESEPVLLEIATIMQKHPDWKLSVSGHTDNIGSQKSNVPLSQRRAAAVKDALVTRFKIAAARLDTAGYGAAQPVATNDTLEGRARNRRVELRRQ